MNTRRWIRTLSMVVVLTGLLFVLDFSAPTQSPVGTRQALQLVAPPFVQTAYAQANPSTFDLGAYLDQEAGISAYYKSATAITLSQVRSAFRTIEAETADYIIGSVAVPNYPENFDVHVYVHKTGWILAYYLKADPVSKIVDVKAQTINSTDLKTVVLTVAATAGAPFTDVTYYDFRYPNATNVAFIAEDDSNGSSFTILVPSTYAYYERSWANYENYYNENVFQFDGVNLPNTVYDVGTIAYGTLTPSQFLPDATHTVAVTSGADAYGVLVLEYQVP